MSDVGVYDISQVDALNRANALMEKGDYEKARDCYSGAIAHDARCWMAYFGRAQALAAEHKWPSALADCESTIRLKPSFYMATIERASINARIGNYVAAMADYDRLVSLHPMAYTYAYVLNDRAWLRATCPSASFRNGREAVSDAKGACNLTSWSQPDYIDTLAAACAESGDFDSAIRFEERALKNVPAANRKGCEQRLAMYQARRPFRVASR